MQIEHQLSPRLLERAVRVLIVGSGGNGSAMLMGLPYLHQAMKVWGHPGGLEVTVVDADTVSETNCVRQPFSRSDIGMNKATVLVNRVNLFWGLDWEARPEWLCCNNQARTGVPETLPCGRRQAGWRFSVSLKTAIASASALAPMPKARSTMRASPRMS